MYADQDVPTKGNRCRTPFIPSFSATITNSKLRGVQSTPLQRSVGNNRGFSLSESMSMLKLDEDLFSNKKREGQATCKDKELPPIRALPDKRSFSARSRNGCVDDSKNALVPFQTSAGSLVAPKTPSQIPVSRKSGRKPDVASAAPETPYKTPKASPTKAQFLSKDSNIPGITAWDVDARLGSIESMYANLQETIKSTTTDRSEMEKEVGIYKLKSKFSVPLVCRSFLYRCPGDDLRNFRSRPIES